LQFSISIALDRFRTDYLLLKASDALKQLQSHPIVKITKLAISIMPNLQTESPDQLVNKLPIWQQLQNFWQTLPALLTPQPVRIEPSLDEQLSDAIAKAVHNSTFRTQLLTQPKQALASLKIQIPAEQAVIAMESTPGQTFLVIPIMTDQEVEILRANANSPRALRAIRSRVLLKAWQDPDYKSKLFADPKALLMTEGFQISDGATITVLENDATHLYLVIPQIHVH
jgi:hypothetical protein